LFACLTVEAFVNYAGGILAPACWKDEKKFFRKDPYRGFRGKIKKLLESVENSSGMDNPPVSTVLDLIELRNRMAHGKPDVVEGEVTHNPGEDWVSSRFKPSLEVTCEELSIYLQCTRAFIEPIQAHIHMRHNAQNSVMESELFGVNALEGYESVGFASTEGPT
jgi:hypothetical protein